MICVEHLSHRIGDADILRDITVDVPKGGVTAMIGPNGAGKSTLLSLIARLYPLQTGRISIDGNDVSTTPSEALARRLAILPQTSEIAPRLTVAQLVAFGRYPHSKGRLTKTCKDRIEQSIERFELQEFSDRMLDTLSGGQRQRALIAMACAQDTDYLLLDEPLNNLDIAASRGLMALLRGMAEQDGRAILIVLHDINYASAYADRIVVLSKGELAGEGAPQDVVTEATLSDTFGTQATILQEHGKPVVLV